METPWILGMLEREKERDSQENGDFAPAVYARRLLLCERVVGVGLASAGSGSELKR